MEDINTKPLSELPIRARVALTLASAERALTILEAPLELLYLATEALQIAWKWEMGQDVSARELYDYIHQLFGWEPAVNNEKQKSALFSIITALYYTTWHAQKAQRSRDPTGPLATLPNDMAEVDEEYVAQCLVYAVEGAADRDEEARWQRNAWRQLVADFQSSSANDLETIITPDYFK